MSFQCIASQRNTPPHFLFLAFLAQTSELTFIPSSSCLSARRRRKLGYQPYKGTAWTLGRQQQPVQQQQPYYNNSNNPAPQHNGAPQYNTGGNQGYYGNDAGVQQPTAAYGGYNSGQPVYAPPAGKPPGH
jgi:hypothetical protein